MENIESLIADIKQSTNFQINKKILREKIQTDLHMPFNNGLFKISMELLSFVQTWPDTILYIEDAYQNPIQIEKEKFLPIAQQHYQLVMNRWHQQYEELKRVRKI